MDGRGVGGGGGHTAAGLLPLPSFCGVGGPPHVEDYAYSYAKQIGLFSSIARTARTLARLALRKRTAARVVVQQLPPFERRSAQVGGVDHRVEKDFSTRRPCTAQAPYVRDRDLSRMGHVTIINHLTKAKYKYGSGRTHTHVLLNFPWTKTGGGKGRVVNEARCGGNLSRLHPPAQSRRGYQYARPRRRQ